MIMPTMDSAIATAPAQAEASKPLGLWFRIAFTAVRLFLWGWARCFSLKGLYLLGQAFGTLEWMINYKRRRRFAQRLAEIYHGVPMPAHAAGACRKFFMRARCDKILYLVFDKLPREKILNRIQFPEERHLVEGLERGNGVYTALSHYGSFHVAGLMMALKGYRCAGVRDANEGAIRRYVQEKYYQSFPEFRKIKILYSDTFPRELYRCFKDNYVVGSASDVRRVREAHLKTQTVMFCNAEREFLIGPLQIALRCKAAVLQGFVISEPNFHYRLALTPPLIDPQLAADTPETVQTVMQCYADNLSEHIRQYPWNVSQV